MSTPYPPSDGRPDGQPQAPYGSQPQEYGSQPQGYGAPAPGGYPGYAGPTEQHGGPAGSPSNGMGWAALALGIVGLLTSIFILGGLLGILAIVFGILALKKSKRGQATNGWAGIVGIITGAIAVLIAGAVLAISVIFADEFGSYSECLSSAGDDQAAVQQCAEDFSNELQ